MKIKRLIVSKYKNVENLDLRFNSPLISLLVGRNGLGKSNLIEILALIFRDLERNETEADFKDWAYNKNHFEYFINYQCRNSELKILCKEGKFRVFRKQKRTKQNFLELSISEFKTARSEEYLPKYIIGYYSGENKRIKEIIQPFEDDVINNLKNNKELEKGLRKIFFAQNHHSQMVLLTLLLYKDQRKDLEFRKKVNKLIKDFCTFESIEELNIELNQPYYYNPKKKKLSLESPNVSIELLEENLLNSVQFPFWGLKGKADKAITFFYNNARKRNNYFDSDNKNKDERVEKLILEDIDKEAAAAGITDHFGSPSDFFDSLESLLLTESLRKINLKVKSKKKAVSFMFSELSEGEQQLITILGLVLMVGHEDCLFLLDEPDTHLNPIWQRQYVKLLKDFNLDDRNSHIIVATHSPLIVQAAEKTDIFLYTKKKEKIEVHFNNEMKIHNWRIDQVLASEYFDFENTRPLSLDTFMKKREELLSKPRLTKKDLKEIANLEQEQGVLPSGETLNDFQAIHLVRTIANESKK